MRSIQKLSKFIQYVLGRCPHEFGLVPDDQGFVKLKTLLQAIHDDPEWRFVRHAHLNELRLTYNPVPIEIQGNLIRAVDRSKLPHPLLAVGDNLPRLLYVPIRRRSHLATTTNGVYPNSDLPHVVLCSQKALALQMGRRIDNRPVLITVKVNEAIRSGVLFKRLGEELFLAPYLSPEVIIVPPLPKTTIADSKSEKPKQAAEMKTPGSFFLDPAQIAGSGTDGEKTTQRKPGTWKKERRQARKLKKKQQAPDGY